MFENVDGRTDDGVIGILIAHLGAFGSGELIKLIYRYIPNNDHLVKTLLTFCGVYHGNRPDIKGNAP